MPQILAAAATAVAAAAPTAAAAAAPASLQTLAVNALTNIAISAAMSILQPQVGLAGRTFEWTIDPDGPIPFAAGEVGVAGAVVHRETFGPDLMYYGVVSVLSGAGPIDSIVSFSADDEAVTFDGNGKATTSQYANELWFKSKLGAQPDTALVSPTGLKNSVTLPNWTSDHKLSGKACYMVVMGENSKQTAFPTGEIKPLVVIRGLKVYDPRLDSTYPGGSGSCRLATPSTWVYSDNPILWALKWALGLWEGPTGAGAPQVDYQVGGIGSTLAGIDVAAFVAAASIADANGWTCSAYPNTDDDKHQVLNGFLQAGGAMYAQRAGKISCIHRAAPRTSIVTISAADTAGPLELDTAASRIDRINTIRPRHWSPLHRWQMTAQPEITVAAYVTADGAKRTRGLDFPFVNNPTQAGQLAALQIEHTREPLAGVIPLKPHLQRIRPGDTFTITEEGFDLDGQKCLCLNTDYDPATGVVRVSFVSETDSKYDALDLTPDAPPDPDWDPNDPTVTPPGTGDWTSTPGTVTGDDGSVVPTVVLAGVVDNDTVDQVIFEYRRDGDTDWLPAGAEGPDTALKHISGLTAGDWEVAVSYRRGRRTSARKILAPVTLAGISVPIDTSGLGDLAVLDKVDTVDIESVAVTNAVDVFTAGSLTLTTSVQTVQSASFTTTGNRLIVDFRFYLNIWHPAGGGQTCAMELKRDSTVIWSITLSATGDDFLFGWQSVAVPDTPSAGTYTYTLTAVLSAGTGTTQTAESRFMSVTEYKR